MNFWLNVKKKYSWCPKPQNKFQGLNKNVETEGGQRDFQTQLALGVSFLFYEN